MWFASRNSWEAALILSQINVIMLPWISKESFFLNQNRIFKKKKLKNLSFILGHHKWIKKIYFFTTVKKKRITCSYNGAYHPSIERKMIFTIT